MKENIYKSKRKIRKTKKALIAIIALLVLWFIPGIIILINRKFSVDFNDDSFLIISSTWTIIAVLIAILAAMVDEKVKRIIKITDNFVMISDIEKDNITYFDEVDSIKLKYEGNELAEILLTGKKGSMVIAYFEKMEQILNDLRRRVKGNTVIS